jgi:hypothetical protein
MPKPLGILINELALKAGVKEDNASLVAFVTENKDLFSKVQLPDDLVTQMETGLHTLDSAKSKLKPTLFAEALNGVDTDFARGWDEFELDDATKAELLAEPKTAKRAILLAKKVKELEAKKKGATGDDKKALVEEINNLKAAASKIAGEHKTAIDKIQADHQDKITDMQYRTQLSGYNYALPKEMDSSVKVETALSTIRNAMLRDGVKIVNADGNLKLVTAKDGSEYFDSSNNKKDLKSYTDGILALNKLLATAEPPGGTGGGGGGTPGGKDLPGAGKQTGSFFESLENQIKAAQPATAS